MNPSIWESVVSIATPLGVTGLALAVFYLLYKVLLQGKLLSQIGSGETYKVINRVVTLVFIVAIMAMLGGFGVYVAEKYISGNKESSTSNTSEVPLGTKKVSIKSSLVRYLLFPPQVSWGDIFRVKIGSNSSQVTVSGLFDKGGDKPVQIDGGFSTKKGGVFIDYKIPENAPLGIHKADIVIRALQGMEQHKETIDYEVVSRDNSKKGKPSDGRLSKETLGFAYIPEGTYEMGSLKGDIDEKPVHQVSVSSFEIMDHEFTIGEMKILTNSLPSLKTALDDGPNYEIEENAQIDADLLPMTLSWDDAQTVAKHLSKILSVGVHLPTEAEWEYAARGGLERKNYPWGNDSDLVEGKRVSVIISKMKPGCSLGMKVYPVKSFSPANGYKLYDLAGNVWEWTSSIYKDYPYKANDGREKEKSEDFRVIRGGGSAQDTCDVRVSFRGYGSTDTDSRYGVRFVIRDK